MAKFEIFYPIVLRNEGGWADKPNDSGGQTWEGISRNNYPTWSGWKIIDSYKPQANFPSILHKDGSLASLVMEFYKAAEWDVILGDEINNQSIANFLADWGTNAGASIPLKHAQEILKITADGKAGPVTIAAINDAPDQAELFKELVAARLQFYDDVIAANPKDEEFKSDWVTRTNSFSFAA